MSLANFLSKKFAFVRDFFLLFFFSNFILIKSHNTTFMYVFDKAAGILRKNLIPTIYTNDDSLFLKYYKKAKIIFEWGNLSEKYDISDKIVFRNISLDKKEQFNIMKSIGINNLPRTSFSNNLDVVSKIGFPILAKPLNSWKCKGIKLLRNKSELNNFFKKNNVKKYLFSEYVKFDDFEYKWRIAMVDDVVLWSYFRKRLLKGYVQPVFTKIPISELEIVDPPKKILEVVTKVSVHIRKNYPSHILGFDVLCDKNSNNFKILEFNPAYINCMLAQSFDNRDVQAKRLANYLLRVYKNG